MFKKFAKIIEIRCSSEYFLFRNEKEERTIPTHGYITQISRRSPNRDILAPTYQYEQYQKTDKYLPISLFTGDFIKTQQYFIPILVAFLWHGVKPLCGMVKPILLFTKMEEFATPFGFEYVIFREAGKLIAFGRKEVYFNTIT
jgi:hypothetical protein